MSIVEWLEKVAIKFPKNFYANLQASLKDTRPKVYNTFRDIQQANLLVSSFPQNPSNANCPQIYREFFPIMDFRGATSKFAAPDFDGAPVVILDDPDNNTAINDSGGNDDDLPPEQPKKKFHVNGVDVEILNERIQFIDSNGNLITENLSLVKRADFVKNKSFIKSFPEKCRAVLNSLLEKYADNGIAEL